ncbi:MAG: hypothetical protein HQ500_04625 [Flavobacteriales bacterium]|nr:hypothetical protein [Flavobacteriales bacterium]
MKNWLIILLLLPTALTSFAQGNPPDEGVPFNKVIFFTGTPEQEYYDPYLYFRYTGIPEILLDEISEAHGGGITYNPDRQLYEIRNTTTPLWYYAQYRVCIQYTEEHLYKVWATYEFDFPAGSAQKVLGQGPPAKTDRSRNSMIMQDIYRDWTNLYQSNVDKALARSLEMAP